MTPESQQVLREALDLPPVDRAELVEQILASFEFPARQEIDAAWAKEAEDRIDAFEDHCVLQIIGGKAAALRDSRQHFGADLVVIVESENDVWPARPG
jgi:putative addiction module component (TIGR02574 family)